MAALSPTGRPGWDWDGALLWGERLVTYSVRFWMIFMVACATAVSTYLLIYRAIVPDARHVTPVHFVFDGMRAPTAEVSVHAPVMVPGQAYALSVTLEMPDSPENLDAGNFMVSVALETQNGTALRTAQRPAILRYRSSLLRQLWTYFYLPFFLLGRSEETQSLRVPLVEAFDNPPQTPAVRATLTLSSPQLRVYSSSLHVVAIFRGLSYYMHTHRLASALVSISAIVFVQFVLIAMLQFRSPREPPDAPRTDGEARAGMPPAHAAEGQPRAQPAPDVRSAQETELRPGARQGTARAHGGSSVRRRANAASDGSTAEGAAVAAITAASDGSSGSTRATASAAAATPTAPGGGPSGGGRSAVNLDAY